MKSLEAFSIIFEPVRPEPVNDIILTFGCSLSGLPTPSPSPLTRLNTPFGTPTLSNISAKITAEMVFLLKVLELQDYPANGANFNEV